MKVAIFDFDNTLVETPYEESIDYMDKSESLDTNRWKFKLKEETITNYKNDKSELKVLLTNRLNVVENEVLNLLSKRNIIFDEALFIEGYKGDRSKGNRVIKLLKKYPDIKEICYWEDKKKHIKDVKNTMKNFPNIKLECIHVKNE